MFFFDGFWLLFNSLPGFSVYHVFISDGFWPVLKSISGFVIHFLGFLRSWYRLVINSLNGFSSNQAILQWGLGFSLPLKDLCLFVCVLGVGACRECGKR